MGEDAIRRRIRELIALDRDKGVARPDGYYARVFKGFEHLVADELGEDDEPAVDEAGADEAPEGGPPDDEDSTGLRTGTTPSMAAKPERAYELIDELARGGMGVVLRVRDGGLRRTLAMKTLFEGEGKGSVAAERLIEEAQVTAQLDHPGVVPVHELGSHPDGRPYFTMKLVRGRPFSEIIRLCHAGEEGWSRPRGVQVVVRVAEALAYAHGKGVIHRDIKPSNVMVGTSGEVYLMDWAIARVVGDPRQSTISTPGTVSTERGTQKATSAYAGTPAYMPPEQAKGDVEALDSRSDVYAVGALLYELLAGEPPYHDTAPRGTPATLEALVAGPPTPLTELAPRVPGQLCAIVERAMAREPGARYPSAAPLREDLQAFVDGHATNAYRTGPVKELQNWCERNRGLAATGAGVVLALAAGVAGLAVLNAGLRGDVTTAERRSYGAELAAAAVDVADGQSADASARLDRVPDELRSWEWRVLRARAAEAGARSSDAAHTLGGHVSAVTALALSADRSLLVSGGLDAREDGSPSIHVWDAATGASVTALGLVNECASSVVFTVDGDIVTCGGAREHDWAVGPVRIWDALSGALVRSLDRSYRTITLAGGEETLVGARDETLEFVDFAEDVALGVTPTLGCTRLRVSPDGSLVACVGDGGVVVVDVATRTEVARLETESGLTDSAFTEDGTLLYLAGGDASAIRVLDLATGQLEAELPGAGARTLCLAAPGGDARLLTGGDDGAVRVLDATAPELLVRLTAPASGVRALLFDASREMLVSAAGDGALRVWDAVAATERTAALQRRQDVLDRVAPRVATALDRTRDTESVLSDLSGGLDGRETDVLRQAILAESVRRRTR